jgi:LysR family transcriptional regulator for bpeEF and oprC
MDRLVSMQAFTRVVDVGSFARAAESLDLPKATLTRLIQNLETHLGVKLLHRTTPHQRDNRWRCLLRTLRPYPGRRRGSGTIADAAQQLAARHAMRRHHERLAQMVLMPHLHDFFNAYPDLKLELTINGKPIDLLKEGVDVVLRVGALDEVDGGAAHRSVKLAFYASPIYLRRVGTPQNLTELAQHKAVNFLSNRTAVKCPGRRRAAANAPRCCCHRPFRPTMPMSTWPARLKAMASPAFLARWPNPTSTAAGWSR